MRSEIVVPEPAVESVSLVDPCARVSAGTSGSALSLSSVAVELQDRREFREPELNIEFDGTTVLCRVCGDKASGFHYGVHSCEGCKGFFRRSIQQKIQYRPCTKNQQCSILRINRNRCQYCRLKKCIAVGMSRDAVRFGRVPKREKAKILAAMQSVNAKSAERALTAELSDETQVMNAVIRAHMETCDFTRDKVDALMSNATRQPDYIACPPTLACPLNPTPAQINGQQQLLQDFSERFSPAIRGVVEFAKRLPGFALLAQDDQVTLLKAGVFEVLLVRLAAMFDSSTNTMLCLNGQLLRRDTLHNSSNARFLMDSMFEFAERLNSLGLNDSELALFCAVVVIAADRPGLRNNDLVERMQSKLRTILEGVLHQSHPEKQGLFAELLRTIPDLRTLNTLHSEKLLAFKMTEQQQQQQQQIQMHLPGLHPQSFIHQTPSPWADRYDDDGTKSPVGSVSSSESIYSSEAGMSDLPLLAAVAGSAVPLSAGHRKIRTAHSEHGSTSSDGEETDVTIRILESPPKTCPFALRKLDSPDDSGIESGMDRYEKLSTTSRSTTTSSICSSPRSSLDDKVKEVEESTMLPAPMSLTRSCPRPGGVDDMPVLKRVLQAPPLFDTNSLMDEAYRQHPHKKFRAHRRDCSDEAKVSIQDSPQSPPTSVLAAALSAPPATSSFAAVSSALTSTHSTLARTLMEAPKLSSEQQRRADLIVTNIMKGTTSAYAAAPGSPSTYYAYRPHHGRIGSPASLPALSPVHNGSPVSSPRPQSVVELQVGISDSQPQPLNLSLKSPASSPDRSNSPVTHAHYFPLHV